MSEASATSVEAARMLAYVRREGGATRLGISNETRMGRAAVIQRLSHLVTAGLLVEGPAAPSTGGRAPRAYRFAASKGRVLTAAVGVTGYVAAVTDLDGAIVASERAPLGFVLGPDRVLVAIEDSWERLLADAQVPRELIWGAGLGLPNLVEFTTGRPLHPTSPTAWDGYDVARQFEDHLDVPCWVDNDANVMALGELRSGAGVGVSDMIFIKVASGVGAGLVSEGDLHRGHGGGAGDIGHIPVSDDPDFFCVCGRVGCLGTAAGGLGIRRKALTAARDGVSSYLAAILDEEGDLTYPDVVRGTAAQDPTCLRLLSDAGQLLGETVATLVDFFNPAVVVLGGEIAETSSLIATRVRESVYTRCTPLSTRDFRVLQSALPGRSGIIGAAHMVTEELLSPACFDEWFTPGEPDASPDLAAVRRALPRAA